MVSAVSVCGIRLNERRGESVRTVNLRERQVVRFMTARHVLVCFSLVTALLIGFAAPSAGYALQDDSSTAVDSGTPEAPADSLGADLDPTEIPADLEPTEIPTAEAEPTEVATVPADLPTAEPTTESSAPSLAVTPDLAPVCTPLPGQPDALALGGNLDYSCVWNVGVSMTGVDPATVGLDWTVTAAARDGWSVRLLPPGHDPAIDTDWTDPLAAPVTFTQSSTLTAAPETDDTGTTRYAEPLSFLARITRSGCDIAPNPISLDLQVAGYGIGLDGSDLGTDPLAAETTRIDPALAPFAEPSIAILGTLDFGAVSVDATGVTAAPSPQALTIVVSGLSATCGSWLLNVDGDADSDSHLSGVDAPRLLLLQVNDVEFSDDGCVVNKAAISARSWRTRPDRTV